MNNCFLCDSVADINGRDFGRVKIVTCNDCGYYEITNTAERKITADDFPEHWRIDFAKKIKTLNSEGRDPKVTFDNEKFNILC